MSVDRKIEIGKKKIEFVKKEQCGYLKELNEQIECEKTRT